MNPDPPAEQAEDEAFLAQWTPYTAPACPVGLLLLRDLARSNPSLYELARKQNFVDPSHPAFETNPAWQAFARHYEQCDDCNEV